MHTHHTIIIIIIVVVIIISSIIITSSSSSIRHQGRGGQHRVMGQPCMHTHPRPGADRTDLRPQATTLPPEHVHLSSW
jgi:hypothetical protein